MGRGQEGLVLGWPFCLFNATMRRHREKSGSSVPLWSCPITGQRGPTASPSPAPPPHPRPHITPELWVNTGQGFSKPSGLSLLKLSGNLSCGSEDVVFSSLQTRPSCPRLGHPVVFCFRSLRVRGCGFRRSRSLYFLVLGMRLRTGS